MLAQVCNPIEFVTMCHCHANPGIVEVRFKVYPLRALGEEHVLMLWIGFHPFEDLLAPFRQPTGEVAESGHKPDMRLLVVQDVEFVPEKYGLGEILGHMETSAVVPGIAVRAADVAADDQVDVLYQGFNADGHRRLFVVQADFLMIEIIDDDRFARLAAAVREVVSQVWEIIVRADLLHLCFKILPVAALPFVVDFIV